MHDALFISAGLAVAYLLGSIPSGLLLARARGVNIRAVGSGNIGATNVFREVGRTWGILTFAFDVLKGLLPAALFPMLFEGQGGMPQLWGLAYGCAAVAGHNWSLFLGFRGGKGVATSCGVLLGVIPGLVALGLVCWLLLLLTTRYVSVASMGAAAAVAAGGWAAYAGRTWWLPMVLTVLAALIVWTHRGNLRRLLRGEEHRLSFGARKRTAEEPDAH
jgi:glycerol-3-phosphate acyltransferase PlsY